MQNKNIKLFIFISAFAVFFCAPLFFIYAQNNQVAQKSRMCDDTYRECIYSASRKRAECGVSCGCGGVTPCNDDSCLSICYHSYSLDSDRCSASLDQCLKIARDVDGQNQQDNLISLNVPLRNQNDPANGQAGVAMCGPASLGMLLDFHGEDNISTRQLATMLGVTNSDSPGASPSDIVSIAKYLGYSGSNVDVFTSAVGGLNYLRSNLSQGIPVIVSVNLQEYSNGHFIVVKGISDDFVTVNDPWTNSETNSERQLGIDQFKAMWWSRYNTSIIIKK